MNTRIAPADGQTLDPTAGRTLSQVEKTLGMVPNLHWTLARAPAALKAYVDMAGALSQGVLDGKLREQIALATAGRNGCDYCASAHTALGQGQSIDAAELGRNLSGASDDARTQAALSFVGALLEHHGRVRDADLEAVRGAGFTDAEIIEIVAHVGLNTFTNTFNNLARPEIDFPVVELAAV